MDKEILIPENEQTPKKDSLRDIFSLIELLAVTAAIILIFFSFIARITVVEGGSMENTLKGGDKLIVSDLFYTPKHGDIVILQSPTLNRGNAIVKRIIAVGGDTVFIKNEGVYVNGVLLSETDGSLGYTAERFTYSPVAPFTVPEGQLFVLGDHRSVSYDSRSFGTIDERAVVGRVLLRIFPLSEFGTVN